MEDDEQDLGVTDPSFLVHRNLRKPSKSTMLSIWRMQQSNKRQRIASTSNWTKPKKYK